MTLVTFWVGQLMHVFRQLGTTARADFGTDLLQTAAGILDDSRKPAPTRPNTSDPHPADLTLYLIEVPQGWELRSWRGRGILYAGLSDPLRLAQSWVEEGHGRMLITRSART